MRSVVSSVHNFLIGFTARAVELLPPALHRSLDAWVQRSARRRAQRRRQRAARPRN